MRTHTFILAANVRAWHRFEVKGLTRQEAAALDNMDSEEALTAARALAQAGRLVEAGVDYEEGAPIWDESSDPAVIDFEELS